MTYKFRLVTMVALAVLLAGSAYLVYLFICSQSKIFICRFDEPEALTVVIETGYPGANARVVADTVATPIEHQVNGVEGLRSMSSQSGDDGRYRLTLTFEPNVDLNSAQVLVQNRVALAQPVLPNLVQQRGVTVKKQSPNVLMIVTVSSPKGRYNSHYLSNYARIHFMDELSRIEGVGEIILFGQHDRVLLISGDPKQLAAHHLTMADVKTALRAVNIKVPDGAIGQPPLPNGQEISISLRTLGRLLDPALLEQVVLKVDGKGGVVRLKDVARLELIEEDPNGFARLDVQEGAALVIYPIPGAAFQKSSAALQEKLSLLREKLPKGLQVDCAFDFAANPEYLVLDPELPAGASTERVLAILQQCEAILRKTPGVRAVMSLSGNPFDHLADQACLLVRLVPHDQRNVQGEPPWQSLRTQLTREIKGAVLRLRDRSKGGDRGWGRYPIDLAIYGPEREVVKRLARKLAERLNLSARLTDVWVRPRPYPAQQYAVDAAAAKAHGVDLVEVENALRVFRGAPAVNRLDLEGRKVSVRNIQGEMVPLSQLVKVRDIIVEDIYQFNEEPMVHITANLAAGVPLAEARSLCQDLAEQVRKEQRQPAAYRLAWLHEANSH